ncbi:MAG TPA: NAD kinase [Cyclobacteriaceae bacterium]|nr:NAD kinase [Cyclobacteriaceae bacterium]
MKICIHGRYFSQDTQKILKALIQEKNRFNFELAFTGTFYKLVSKYFEECKNYSHADSREKLAEFDIMISIGGDGTLLETVTITGKLQQPILGINTGRLGFLTSASDKNIEQVMNDLFNKKFTLDERALIRLDSDVNPFGEINFALNEVAILKSDSSSMITVNAYIDDKFLNSYWADGLVVSTPTGSTGYSLSCGGPVVVPRSNNFIITPIGAHNLSVRPIVVSDQSRISFEIESRSGQFLVSLDSRSHTFHEKKPISIRRESFTAKLIKFTDYNYFDTLRKKLNWGLDVRN